MTDKRFSHDGRIVETDDNTSFLRVGDGVRARWDEFQSTALPLDDVEVEDQVQVQ